MMILEAVALVHVYWWVLAYHPYGLCLLHVCAGSVLLRVGELPNGQDCDNWHQLAIPGTRASRGNLRLVATFKHEVILPLEEYRAFSEVR